MLRFTVGGILGAIVALIIGATAVAQQPESIELDWTLEGVDWVDNPDEHSYRIVGHVTYLEKFDCGLIRPLQESVQFDEILPADTMSYGFPTPNDPRLTWAKGGQFTLEALAADGTVIAMNGGAWTADGFCTPEEIAAAGTGFDGQPGRDMLPLVTLGLLAFGVLAVSASLKARGVA